MNVPATGWTAVGGSKSSATEQWRFINGDVQSWSKKLFANFYLLSLLKTRKTKKTGKVFFEKKIFFLPTLSTSQRQLTTSAMDVTSTSEMVIKKKINKIFFKI